MKPRSPETNMIADRLKKAAVGDLITYEELSGIMKMDARDGKGRSVVSSAFKIVLHEDQMVFKCEPKIGYKRLTDSEIVAGGRSILRHIGKSARRGARKQACVDFTKLTGDEKLKLCATASILNAVSHAASPQSVKQIEGAIEKTDSKSLPASVTLKLLRQF